MPLVTPRRGLCLLALAALVAVPALAQTVGDCETGRAQADLDVNDVNARVFNTGSLFFGNATVAGDGYLVPKAAGLSPIFAASLWVGGKVDGELRLVGSTYADFEFWPGPLDAAGNPPTDCFLYDRIYRVSRGDVARYLDTGVATDDLRDWPAHLGAPVLDGDGVAGNYDLAGGDEPAISGDQMAWWVMNDRGNAHVNNLTLPLGLEVRVEVFAAASLALAVNQATLYRYRIRYRGSEPLDSAYVAIFVDPDLGDPADDYVGTDTTLHMAFTYNADDDDAGGLNGGYGSRPPALGFMALRTPARLPDGRDNDGDGEVDEAGEPSELYANNVFCPDGFIGPFNALGNYRCLGGLHRDGTPVTEGGDGYMTAGDTLTTFFPGDPVTEQFWSEENIDGTGADDPAGDRQMWPSFGPFRLEPGEETEFTFAIPFARGEDRLDSIVKLREAARYLQRAYDFGLFEPQRLGADFEPTLPSAFALSRPAPNPFGASASFTLTVPEGAETLRLAVYDVLGREVAVLADGMLAPGDHPLVLDGARLAAGVYFVRLQTQRQTESLKLVRIE
ncbi:MAG: T9SS type A sorting domain-containing protein [Rhodothermales bacterium]